MLSSPTAAMTQFKSATEASSFAAEAARLTKHESAGPEVVGKTEFSLESTSRGTETVLTVADSSLGRDKASATKLALPWTYRMSVVYSEIHESWYV